MFEKINVFKSLADWWLNLTPAYKFNLLLTVLIGLLIYRNYQNGELCREAARIKDIRFDECVSRFDSINLYYSKEIIRSQKEAYDRETALYERFEKKYKELYDRTQEIIKKQRNENSNFGINSSN